MHFDKKIEMPYEHYTIDETLYEPYLRGSEPKKPQPRINVRVIGSNDLDPAIIEFLPPEIRNVIFSQKDNVAGSDGTLPPLERKEEEQEEPKHTEKVKYNFKMVNCNQDLKTLVEKLKKSKVKKWNMLLYGVSGSGKSYLAKYIAQELGLNFIKVKVSDIQDKFVGQTEKNLREAFQNARKKNALLCFDECDSMLWDRRMAKQDFQAASVNEMLVQLEEHELPVILTTNLRGQIDSAVNRRVLFKIKFDYMTKDNIKEGVKTYMGKEFSLTKEQLNELKYITAGDFKVVKDKAAVLDDGIFTNESIYDYLKKEQDEKDADEGSGEITI